MRNKFEDTWRYKVVLTSVALMSALFLSAQNTYDMKVSGKGDTLRVEYADTALYVGVDNHFFVHSAPGAKLGRVEVKGGEVSQKTLTSDGYTTSLIVKVKAGEKALLSLYTLDARGRQRLAFSNLYSIIMAEDPMLFVGEVNPDSIIYREDLMRDDYLYCDLTLKLRHYRLRVKSFDLVVWRDTNELRFSSLNARLTAEMKRAILRLPEGSSMRFENILCFMPNGNLKKLKPATLFYDPRPRVKVVTSN